MSKIKIPYAMKDGEIVHIDSVERGQYCECTCPICKEPLQAKKGAKKTHHFSHIGKQECNAETVLHHLGKVFLYKRIQERIKKKEEFWFDYFCHVHNSVHEGNLTRKAARVVLENDFGECIPDITIFEKSGRPRIAIEVVVAHCPEFETIDYCVRNRIFLFQLKLKNHRDLSNVQNGRILFDWMYHDCPE